MNMPLLQPQISDLPPEVAKLQKYLRSQASQGQLLLPVSMIHQHFGSTSQDTINKALQKELIHQTIRKFAQLEPMTFISLNLRILSMESLSWVLSSLCADEMTPNETTVKNRIKEAFALKVDQNLWNAVIRAIQDEQNSINLNNDESISNQSSFTEPIIDTGSSIPTNSQPQSSQQKKFSFKLLPAPEAQSDFQDQFLIYHRYEPQWTGVDSELSISHIDPGLYEITKEFLKEYFSQKQSVYNSSSTINNNSNNNHHHNSHVNEESTTSAEPQIDWIDENTRAIPGGRYGCTQYLKFCGPAEIRDLTVGRISLMVKQLIKDDWLRHHKTLLVWSAAVDKHKAAELEQQSQLAPDPEDQLQAAQKAVKLKQVKQALIEILAESKQGMSLAQLPQNLNKKLDFGFNPNELGFAKLKDLIQSMDKQIKLDLKGQNHPFAYLIKKYEKGTNKSEIQIPRKDIIFEKQVNQSSATIIQGVQHLQNNNVFASRQMIENIMNAFMNLMKENPQGIKSFELNRLISGKLGCSFSPKDLNCNSELEFIKKYIQPAFEIELLYVDNNFKQCNDRCNAETPKDDDNYFVIRSTQYYRQMMMCQQQHLAMVYQNIYNNQQQPQPGMHHGMHPGMHGQNHQAQGFYDLQNTNQSPSQMASLQQMQQQFQMHPQGIEPGRFSFGTQVQQQLNLQQKQIPIGAPLEHLVYNHMDEMSVGQLQNAQESLPIPNSSPRMLQQHTKNSSSQQIQNGEPQGEIFIPTTETQYDEKSIFGISDVELSNISMQKHAFDHQSMWAESLFMQPNTFTSHNNTGTSNISYTDQANILPEGECMDFIQKQFIPEPTNNHMNPDYNNSFGALLVSPQTTQDPNDRCKAHNNFKNDNSIMSNPVGGDFSPGFVQPYVKERPGGGFGNANTYGGQGNTTILSQEANVSVFDQSMYQEAIPQIPQATSSQHKVNKTEIAQSEDGPSPQKLKTPFASVSSQGSNHNNSKCDTGNEGPVQLVSMTVSKEGGGKQKNGAGDSKDNNRITEQSNESFQSNPSPPHTERIDLS